MEVYSYSNYINIASDTGDNIGISATTTEFYTDFVFSKKEIELSFSVENKEVNDFLETLRLHFANYE